jgi:hypothetical protein
MTNPRVRRLTAKTAKDGQAKLAAFMEKNTDKYFTTEFAGTPDAHTITVRYGSAVVLVITVKP